MKIKNRNSVKETAKILGKSVSGIHHLLLSKKLKAEKIGNQYVITGAEIRRYKKNQK